MKMQEKKTCVAHQRGKIKLTNQLKLTGNDLYEIKIENQVTNKLECTKALFILENEEKHQTFNSQICCRLLVFKY